MKLDGRHEALAFLGELGRAVAFALFIAAPVGLLELAARLLAKLR